MFRLFSGVLSPGIRMHHVSTLFSHASRLAINIFHGLVIVSEVCERNSPLFANRFQKKKKRTLIPTLRKFRELTTFECLFHLILCIRFSERLHLLETLITFMFCSFKYPRYASYFEIIMPLSAWTPVVRGSFYVPIWYLPSLNICGKIE